MFVHCKQFCRTAEISEPFSELSNNNSIIWLSAQGFKNFQERKGSLSNTNSSDAL